MSVPTTTGTMNASAIFAAAITVRTASTTSARSPTVQGWGGSSRGSIDVRTAPGDPTRPLAPFRLSWPVSARPCGSIVLVLDGFLLDLFAAAFDVLAHTLHCVAGGREHGERRGHNESDQALHGV